ncbi:hypothetical protein WME99_25660 [Sorangium sp. So ce136]|uniref:hypothetical protein n=1 Tax=Sorangium sp. So ce136 TaxID=3133284 RepID=UPI003F01456C
MENNRVLGAGAAEKGGVCLMLDLAERRPPVRADITLIYHAGGECGFDGSELRLVMAKDAELRGADFTLVLSPRTTSFSSAREAPHTRRWHSQAARRTAGYPGPA